MGNEILKQERDRPLSILERVKASIDIATSLEQYAGVQFRKNPQRVKKLSVSCPFHSDDSPSMVVFTDTDRFKCYGCGAKGDQIDAVALARGISIKAALEILQADLGISDIKSDDRLRERVMIRRKAAAEYRVSKEERELAIEHLEWLEREIKRLRILLQDVLDLDWIAPYIHRESMIRYRLEILAYVEDGTDEDRAEIIQEALSDKVREFALNLSAIAFYFDTR